VTSHLTVLIRSSCIRSDGMQPPVPAENPGSEGRSHSHLKLPIAAVAGLNKIKHEKVWPALPIAAVGGFKKIPTAATAGSLGKIRSSHLAPLK
jgi:hypothetical protein